MEAEKIIGAIAQFGANAYIVENIKQANEVLEEIENGIEEIDMTDEEEKKQQMSWLDLEEKNNVKKIYYIGKYGSQRGTICFKEDWE